MARVVSPSYHLLPPWTWPWWRPAPGQYMTLVWILLIHVTAVVGLVVFQFGIWSFSYCPAEFHAVHI